MRRISQFFKKNKSQSSVQKIVVAPQKKGTIIFVYVPGSAEITFNSPTIKNIAAQFYYQYIPVKQVHLDMQSAYAAAKAEHPHSQFFILQVNASKVKKDWWTNLKKDLINVTSFYSKDTLDAGKIFPVTQDISLPPEHKVLSERKRQAKMKTQFTLLQHETSEDKQDVEDENNNRYDKDENTINVPEANNKR